MCNMGPMIVIAGHARVDPVRLAGALGAAREMAAASRDEPGCLDYRFAVDVDDPAVVRIFEHWETADALARHFETPHFAEFSKLLADVLDGEPSFMRYEVDSVGPLFG